MGIYRVSVKKQEVAFMSDHGFSDKAKSAVNKVKGEAKDQWGNATNDSKKETEGKMDKAKGKVQEKTGKAKEYLNEEDEKSR